MHPVKCLYGGLLLVAFSLTTSPAAAQDFGFMSYYNPYSYGAGFGWGGGTADANYMYGMSDVIRASGEYNLYTSQAGVNNEEARSRYLDNKKKWTQDYFQMQEQRQKLDAQRREAARHSPEALNVAAKSALPRALPPDAFDPLTGHINWPETLLGSEFEGLRNEVERLLELRAKTSHGAGAKDDLRAATQQMASLLRQQVANIPANAYMAARKFLDSLDYAVRTNAL